MSCLTRIMAVYPLTNYLPPSPTLNLQTSMRPLNVSLKRGHFPNHGAILSLIIGVAFFMASGSYPHYPRTQLTVYTSPRISSLTIFVFFSRISLPSLSLRYKPTPF